MLPREKLSDALDRAIQYGDWAELFLERRKCCSILWDGGELRQQRTWEEAGIALRVVRQTEELGADYSTDLSPSGLRALADRVCSSLGPYKGNRPAIELGELQEAPPTTGKVDPHEVALAQKTACVEAIGQAILESGPGIMRALVKYDDYTQEVVIANSEGLLCRDVRPLILIMAISIASDGGEIRIGGAAQAGPLDLLSVPSQGWTSVGREAAERALRQRGAILPPTDGLPVLFSPRSGFIHEMLGHPLEARHADGIFAGKVGQLVASPVITLIADATLPGLGGSYASDDEGVPAQRTVLVEKGVLCGFMCDRLGAARLGLVSTGNGRRASFRHPLLSRMSNTVLATGEMSQQEMLAGIERGLLVETTLGNRSNAYGGPARFHVVESYLIEKGQITAPVQSFVLTGKPSDVMLHVSQVGADSVPATGMCGLPESGYVPYGDSQPSIRVEKGVQIAGLLDLDQMLPALLGG